MFNPKLKRYQKKFDFSYSFGAYPTLSLLEKKGKEVLKIILKKDSLKSDGVEEIVEICKRRNIVVEYNERVIEKIAVKENTYVVGVFKKYSSVVEKGNNHVLLVNPSNMGNLGTIIRTMLGFGFRDLVLIRPCTDIFDPMVVRSSMGALFDIRFEMFDSIDEYICKYEGQNLYPFMLEGSKEIREVEFREPFTIIHGNEGSGLSNEYLNLGESVYIAHGKEIDSLNLSVATCISLWESKKCSKALMAF